MAEDEIRKHTKAAYNAMRNTEKDWKHKLGDVLVEILIIVFAVSISIWLHNWSDARQDRQEEQESLTGIQADLAVDVQNLQSNLQFYKSQLQGINYFAKVGAGEPLDKDSMAKYGNLFLSSTSLEPQTSRYQALKGSGRFKIIENNKLLDSIIHLHEETIPGIELLNKIYYTYSTDKVSTYINEHLQLDAQGHLTNAQQVLRTSQMRFFLAYESSLISDNIISNFNSAIQECNNIIVLINKNKN